MGLKKVLSMLMVVMLMLSSVKVAFAFEGSRKVIRVNGYTVTVVADTENYQKLEILHDDTQKVEMLESIKEGIEWKYISIVEGEKYYMEKNGDHFLIFSDNKNIIQDIDLSRSFINIKMENLSVTPDADWGNKVYFEGNTGVIVGLIGAAIAIVAAIARVPAGHSIAITVATTIIGLATPIGYYKGYFQTKWEDAMYHTRRYTTFYKYSNYTGQIGQTIYFYDFH